MNSTMRMWILRAGIYTVLAAFALAALFPLVWLFYTALKSDQDIFFHPFQLPALNDLRWDNFSRAWVAGRFGTYFFNSVAITLLTVILTTLIAAMAAYALSRFSFSGATPLFYFFLAGLMIPLQLAVIPLFFQLKVMHLLGTRGGLLLVYIAFNLPFAIFILCGFFKSLPASLHEAALIDGCGEIRAFFLIMLPLLRPALVTVAIFTFIAAWNEFFLAFMLLSGEGAESVRTLPLGMANLTIASQYRTDWGQAFAGLALMTLPVLCVYVLLQRRITKGVTLGALKG